MNPPKLGSAFQNALNLAFALHQSQVRKSADVMARFASASRKERMDEMVKALGPQRVRVFGTEPDTRLALVCVAADYELKRFALGLDRAPVAGVGRASALAGHPAVRMPRC